MFISFLVCARAKRDSVKNPENICGNNVIISIFIFGKDCSDLFYAKRSWQIESPRFLSQIKDLKEIGMMISNFIKKKAPLAQTFQSWEPGKDFSLPKFK